MHPRDNRLFPKCQTCEGPCPPGKRKCYKCKVPRKMKITTIRPSTKGKNARGTCLHKPDKPRTKRAKKQYPPGTPPPGFRDPFIPYKEG